MRNSTRILAVFMVMVMAFSWCTALRADTGRGSNAANSGTKDSSPLWDWATDMQVSTTPALPGLGGIKNPDHLQKIEIRVVSKNAIKIERAKFVFNATAWDQKIIQGGTFYMNKTSDTNWYIVLGISYFYTQPWDNQIQEDAYDTRLMVTAGTVVKWNVQVQNLAQSPSEISSPIYSYTVDGSWYRIGNTEPEIFANNIDVTYPAGVKMYDKVQIKLTVREPPPGSSKPKIYMARIHVGFQFKDLNMKDIPDMQLDAVPMQPVLSYNKTATIIANWHYKPDITVTFWAECWLEASKRYYHISSTTAKTWGYVVTETGLWKYPPPKGTFDQNVEIKATPDVLHNANAAINPGQPGCGNVTVTVRSLFTAVSLWPAQTVPGNPYRYVPGSMLWYTIKYEDGFQLVDDKGSPKYFPILPDLKRSNNTVLIMTIPPMNARLFRGEISFYVEVWNSTKKNDSRLYSDANPASPDTRGMDDPYRYKVAEALAGGNTEYTSFIVWVYDDRYETKYVPSVNVSFFNGTNLNIPIGITTTTNGMGWCYPAVASGDQPMLLKLHDLILIKVQYDMPVGGGSSTRQRIEANYTYKIEKGTVFSNVSLMKEYIDPYKWQRYIYYVVVGEMPNVTANIFFKFNWKPPKAKLIYADVQGLSNEYLAVGTGIIATVVTLVPAVIILDKRRKKAEEDEKRVTL